MGQDGAIAASRGSRGAARLGRACIVGAVALVVPLTACGDDPKDAAREGRVYAAVVRALVPVPDDTDDVDIDVYVVAADDDTSIPIGVQAATVEELDEYSNVRFVDDRDEATAVDEPGLPVRNDGVMIVVGPVPDRGERVTIDAQRYIDEVDHTEFRLVVEQQGQRWEVPEPPPLDG